MCFNKRIPLTNYLEGEYKGITGILNRDVIVYKIVIKHTRLFPFLTKNSYFAPFYDYEYKKKKVDISPLQIGFRKGDEYIDIVVENGFHSFRTLKDLKDSILWSSDYVVAKFIIPKGSTVIINDTQIVSNKIMFYKEVNPNND
jgi:hypothetical protein|nr:MAG TPA: hypothetical protein [Crassvirales sp.]